MRTKAYRLVDVIFRARPKLAMLLERLVARLARHDDERDVFEIRVLLELVADRKPVHPRELDREQDQIGFGGRGLLQTCIPIVHDQRRTAEFSQLGSKLARERRVALEHEDFGAHDLVREYRTTFRLSRRERRAGFYPMTTALRYGRAR